jgi:hypothetical protein
MSKLARSILWPGLALVAALTLTAASRAISDTARVNFLEQHRAFVTVDKSGRWSVTGWDHRYGDAIELGEARSWRAAVDSAMRVQPAVVRPHPTALPCWRVSLHENREYGTVLRASDESAATTAALADLRQHPTDWAVEVDVKADSGRVCREAVR